MLNIKIAFNNLFSVLPRDDMRMMYLLISQNASFDKWEIFCEELIRKGLNAHLIFDNIQIIKERDLVSQKYYEDILIPVLDELIVH